MPKTTHRLTAIRVQNLKKPGLHADGAGLYLKVQEGGSKSWVFRFMRAYLGLGSASSVNLAAARSRAADARQRLQRGQMRKKMRQRLLELFPEFVNDPRLPPAPRSAPAKCEHAKCGAQTRRKTACQRKALANGRCPNHGGLSSGPKTPLAELARGAVRPTADTNLDGATTAVRDR